MEKSRNVGQKQGNVAQHPMGATTIRQFSFFSEVNYMY
jgi:hypothetical protein